jgi:lysophospholipase L1-like esterase
MRLLPAATAVLALCVLATPAAARKVTPTYYVSLGTSLSVGVQPNSAGRSVETKEGYADRLFALERPSHKGLRLAKLGCGGETTTSMLNGGICQYSGERRLDYSRKRKGAQLKAAEAFLRAHAGRIAFVTIDIGANDILRCAKAKGTIDLPCVTAALETIKKNVPAIAKRLRKAAGSKTTVVGMTLYNPFLALYFDQDTRGLADASVMLARNLNASLTDGFTTNGIGKVADVARAFQSDDRTPTTYQGQSVPLDVERICTLTWMCVFKPVGPNVHANVEGYKLIARTFAPLV